MKLSKKQKDALEIISGRSWDSFYPEAIEAYFAFTDLGRAIQVSKEASKDFDELILCHKQHPIDVESWKWDFVSHGRMPPLLFPWEFFNQGYPDAYVKHVLEIYLNVRGYIPIDEVSGCYKEALRLGVVDANYS